MSELRFSQNPFSSYYDDILAFILPQVEEGTAETIHIEGEAFTAAYRDGWGVALPTALIAKRAQGWPAIRDEAQRVYSQHSGGRAFDHDPGWVVRDSEGREWSLGPDSVAVRGNPVDSSSR